MCLVSGSFICIFFYQVEYEFIYYVHDGSETSADCFTVTANDTGLRKQSAAQTVHIQVSAVNDEPPVITANRVLRVSRHCCSIFKLFFFTGMSGSITYSQTISMWAVLQIAIASWIMETMYAMWNRVQRVQRIQRGTQLTFEGSWDYVGQPVKVLSFQTKTIVLKFEPLMSVG